MCMFCRSFFVLLYFIWLLCTLFFFDIRILIAPLVSSNSSKEPLHIKYLCNIEKTLIWANQYILIPDKTFVLFAIMALGGKWWIETYVKNMPRSTIIYFVVPAADMCGWYEKYCSIMSNIYLNSFVYNQIVQKWYWTRTNNDLQNIHIKLKIE